MKKFSVVAAVSALPTLALAAGPSAGDLSMLTPDPATVLTAIGAVGIVIIGIQVAIMGFSKIQGLLRKNSGG